MDDDWERRKARLREKVEDIKRPLLWSWMDTRHTGRKLGDGVHRSSAHIGRRDVEARLMDRLVPSR